MPIYKLIVKCLCSDRGGWKFTVFHGVGTLACPIKCRSRKPVERTMCFLLMTSGLFTSTNCALYTIYIQMSNWWGMLFALRYQTVGEGMAYGGLPFPGAGFPVSDVANIYLIWNDWCMVFGVVDESLASCVVVHFRSMFLKDSWRISLTK